MAKSLNPSHTRTPLPQDHLQILQSFHKQINGNIEPATPTGKNVAGIWNTFDTANTSSVFFRIGATGGTEAYNWAAANTGLVIKHGLGRQPIGYRVVDQDKDATVYRTAAPDATQITLAITDNTVNVTVEVF